jgi:cell wall assembly regulator SMI1
MDEIWDRIEAWLAQHAPAVLAGLNGPATEQELDATERALGVTLPEDVRASYRRHNGQPDRQVGRCSQNCSRKTSSKAFGTLRARAS